MKELEDWLLNENLAFMPYSDHGWVLSTIIGWDGSSLHSATIDPWSHRSSSVTLVAF